MSNPARMDLLIVAGDDFSLEVNIVDSTGTPVNLTGRNYISQTRQNPTGTGTPELSFTCSVPTPANGTVIITATDAATEDLVPSVRYWWSLLELAGSIETTLLYGQVEVLPQVAKD